MTNLFDVNSEVPFMKYIGGKQFARKEIAKHFPENLDVLVSPFIGGGSVELLMASRGTQVKAYDNHPALIRHWNVMLKQAGEVAVMVNKIFPVKKSILTNLVKEEKMNEELFPSPEKDVTFAAIATCMARQCYNGHYMRILSFRGPFDPEFHKTPEQIEQSKRDKKVLDRWKPMDENLWASWKNDNLSVALSDWEDTFDKHPTEFMFLDPPYVGRDDYYGPYKTKKTKWQPKPFDHHLFADRIAEREGGAIITYQDHSLVRELFDRPEFEVQEKTWHQGSRARNGSNNAIELFITKEKRKLFVPVSETIETRADEDCPKVGDPTKIARVYGGYYEDYMKPMPCLSTWIEKRFSRFDPKLGGLASLDGISKECPHERFGTKGLDLVNIVNYLLEKGIIVKKVTSSQGERLGYPDTEVSDMDAHISEMKTQGIPVKAGPHHSFSYENKEEKQ